jgi:hypothetical protein
VAEGLDADAGQGREFLSESEILFRSGEYGGSSTAADNSAQTLTLAAADSAGLAITQAEQNIREFAKTGVRFPPAADCLTRSREALELQDFLGSVHYARMASKLAQDARRQVDEAKSVITAYERALERAQDILGVTDEEQAVLKEAKADFEGGQMRRAQDLILRQQQSLHDRARNAHREASKEVEELAQGLELMGTDAGPARNEAKESALAMEEGRFMDALTGVVAARTFARDQLGERVGARGVEVRALVEEFDNAGFTVEGAGEALEKFQEAADALDAKAAAGAEKEIQTVCRRTLDGQAAKFIKGLQRAGEQRYFRHGAGAKDYQSWKSQAADLRGLLRGKDYGKALAAVVNLKAAVETGLSELLAENLVEIDAIREVHLPRRDPTEEEQAMYGAVVEAADRGRATLDDLDQGDKLDAALRDWSSKFVTDTKNRINREIMLFQDKAAVEQLKTRLAAIDRARASPAGALQAAYELLDEASELFRERAEGLVEGAKRQVEATRAVEADAAAVQDFIDRAEVALLESQVTEAVDFAESALKEAARLQEAQVLDMLKRAKQDYEAAPEGKVKEEAKRYLQESLQARQTKEFEAAFDFGRKSREVLLQDARELAKPVIEEVAAAADALEAQGIEAGDLRESVAAVEADFDAWETRAAGQKLAQARKDARGRMAATQEASEAVERLAARVGRALDEKVDASKVEARLAAARDKLKTGDFDATKEEAAAGARDLDKLMLTKVKALVTSAQVKVKHNRNLDIESKPAEELLRSAEKLLKEGDIEGAFDAVARAIEEANQAKVQSRQVRKLGEQGTELLEKAAESGVAVSEEQERVIFDAAKGKLKGDFTVVQLEAFIDAVRDQVGAGGPRLVLSMATGEPLVVNRTNNAVLEIQNLGDEAADDVDIAFSGELSVRTRGGAVGSVAPGERKSVELQFISRKMGKIPVRVLTTYKDGLTGQAKRRTERRWMTLFDATDTQDIEQFYRRDERCLVCVGGIGKAEAMKVCGCQSTFHVHCAAGVKECPKCGRGLDES